MDVVISKECRIPGTNIILESGDKIVFNEFLDYKSFIGNDDVHYFANAVASVPWYKGASYDKKTGKLYLFGPEPYAAYNTVYLYYDPARKVFTGTTIYDNKKCIHAFRNPVDVNVYMQDEIGFEKALTVMSQVVEEFAEREKKAKVPRMDLKYFQGKYKQTKDPAIKAQIQDLQQKLFDLHVAPEDIVEYMNKVLANTIFRG